MSSMTFAWREHGVALGAAVALHFGLGVVVFNLSQSTPMAPVVSAVLTTQLVSLPAPAPEVPAPAPVIDQPTAPVVPEVPAPKPVVEAPKVDQAALALKRVQQEKARQVERERQQRVEENRRQEQLARDAQQREALEREQQMAQARQAEADRRAAAEAAEANSRQYLPIAKQAPDYPQRALDRKIEGECTVAYRVNAQGRVEDPQVVGECHPLFVKPSLAAAKGFRYQPKMVNGQAVAVSSVKNTFSYRIR